MGAYKNTWSVTLNLIILATMLVVIYFVSTMIYGYFTNPKTALFSNNTKSVQGVSDLKVLEKFKVE